MRSTVFGPLFGALCLVLVLAPLAAGAGEEVFAVDGVAVDESADSAVAARETAIAAGHRLAVRRLVEKLVPASQWPLVLDSSLTLQQIYPLISDFAVANERTSDVRYLADLSFRFHADTVRDLFRGRGVSFAVTRSKPVLVVPVLGAAEEARLWQDNTWYLRWASYDLDRGLVPLFVPLGDLGDVSAVDAAAALAGDSQRLGALAGRYGADEVLVAQAVLSEASEGGGRLEVNALQISALDQGAFVTSYDLLPGEPPEAVMDRAIAALDQQIQERWKQGNLLQAGDERSIQALVDTRQLQDWLELRRRLAKVTTVERVEVLSLSKVTSKVQLGFVGTEYQLTTALAQQDLFLALNADSEWELGLAENFASGVQEGQPQPGASELSQ